MERAVSLLDRFLLEECDPAAAHALSVSISEGPTERQSHAFNSFEIEIDRVRRAATVVDVLEADSTESVPLSELLLLLRRRAAGGEWRLPSPNVTDADLRDAARLTPVQRILNVAALSATTSALAAAMRSATGTHAAR